MKSLLPIIIVVLTLTGAVTYSLSKKATQVKKDTNRFGISANKLTENTIPKFRTDTRSTNSSMPVITPTATIKPLPTTIPIPKAELPEVQEGSAKNSPSGTEKKIASLSTTTTICTPVYGMANTCVEHITVDTGGSDSLFFNLAGFSYLGGL